MQNIFNLELSPESTKPSVDQQERSNIQKGHSCSEVENKLTIPKLIHQYRKNKTKTPTKT